MLSNNKNIIVGERSNLFAVSSLRFLIIIFCLILSLRAQSLKACHVERSRDAGNVSGYGTEKEIRNILFNTAPGDSSKTKYDINDPRNPHCPCHQYQKQADDEYAKLQNKEKIGVSNFLENGFNEKGKKSGRGNRSQVTDKNFGKQNLFSNFFGFHYKKKKFNRRNEKTKELRLMKYKISDKLSRCFHF